MDLSPQVFAAAGHAEQNVIHVRNGHTDVNFGSCFGSLRIPVPDCDVPADVARLLGTCDSATYNGRSKAIEAVTPSGVTVKVPLTTGSSGGTMPRFFGSAARNVPRLPEVATIDADALQHIAATAVDGGYTKVAVHPVKGDGSLMCCTFGWGDDPDEGPAGTMICGGIAGPLTAPDETEQLHATEQPDAAAEPLSPFLTACNVALQQHGDLFKEIVLGAAKQLDEEAAR